jgi:hypothetical protein
MRRKVYSSTPQYTFSPTIKQTRNLQTVRKFTQKQPTKPTESATRSEASGVFQPGIAEFSHVTYLESRFGHSPVLPTARKEKRLQTPLPSKIHFMHQHA